MAQRGPSSVRPENGQPTLTPPTFATYYENAVVTARTRNPSRRDEPKLPEGPLIGGDVAKHLHRLRDEIYENRRKTAEERSKRPSVADFYKGRHVLVTGGSGFLGRMLIEQLLRTCRDIGNIYIVLRAKKGESPERRLQALVSVQLFDRLRAEQPDALSKIIVLPGDITALGLGLSRQHQDLVRREVSVVYHVAASVRFDDPIQKAILTNVRSTREVVELARGMRIAALVHVSTAYTNMDQYDPVLEKVYPTEVDWRSAIRMAEEMSSADLWAMDCLGHKLRGFHVNTYTFTKAMAEKVIDDVAEELPVIIVRPSIVIPAYKDPIPGWIDNLNGMGGMWAAGGKGLIRVLYEPNPVIFNTVPADLAVKNTILASWVCGQNFSLSAEESVRRGANVVNATTPGDQRLGVTHKDMAFGVENLSNRIAFPGCVRDPKTVQAKNYVLYTMLHWYHHILFSIVLDTAARLTGRKPRLLMYQRNVMVGLQATEPFMKTFNFGMENQNYLQTIIHPKDEEAYSTLDFYGARASKETLMDWAYNCVRGVMVYTLKEEVKPENVDQIPKLKMLMKLYHGTIAALVAMAVYVMVG
ncbi:fatty acyl-CoA reductase 1-like isoform X2 [Frankliniella occidentalis]|uniref:Fatty acyl-CoA reductase n=1 Tax=Frankliniella occidentalis TaxID=133901 RepID=A0A6J1SWG0_FRAOC|nr:fatty acyl-CoA reductase 1-like isoform X2 [Frankliniella occidentalis]